MEVKNDELKMVYGGKSKWTIGVVIGVIATLIAGIFDGFLRPLSCNQ